MPRCLDKCPLLVCLMAAIVSCSGSSTLAQGSGKITIHVEDEKTSDPLLSRVKILGANEKPVRIRGSLHQSGWNLVKSPFKYEGKVGEYTYEITHGPRYARGYGGFTLDKKSEATDVVRLPSYCDLDAEGWRGGDMAAFVKRDEAMQWLPAEDLTMAVVLPADIQQKEASPTNVGAASAGKEPTAGAEEKGSDSPKGKAPSGPTGRWVDDVATRWVRGDAALTIHHWRPAPADAQLGPAKLIGLAKVDPESFTEIQHLWAEEVPIWLASGRVDGVQLLSDHLTIDGKQGTPVTPPAKLERNFSKDQRGSGMMVENLYWKLLEAGFRLVPTAGSSFGKNSSPLGYNRVYAHTGSETLPQGNTWWQSLRRGAVFASNGPLLRVRVNGNQPGHIFTSDDGRPIDLDIGLVLTVADPVEYLDVVFNGKTIYQARLDEHAKRGGKIPPQTVKESGWLVIRVITERDFTYRMATTAPYYIEFNNQGRISRKAVEYCQRWLEAGISQMEKSKATSKSVDRELIESCRLFWKDRLAAANAD